MKKIKYVKACPFLRDLGDSYLCVNNDKVEEVVMDPLISIEWSEEISPVASDTEGITTCLFVLDIQDDDRLFCISRKMYLSMDKKEIKWNDIRDAVFLLNLDQQSEVQNNDIDFCSTCLYKVLIASSSAFQSKLTFKEKMKLGWSYILNKANEIYSTIIKLNISLASRSENKLTCNKDKPKEVIFKHQITAFNWIAWMIEDELFDEEFTSQIFEWLQKFDEWGLVVSKIADAETDELRLDFVEQSYRFAARLKEISYDLTMKIVYYKTNIADEITSHLKNVERIITVVGVQFEDYMFICNQFLEIIKEN
ncbi:MAG: hypothetical protein HZR80_17010 [Candidatus Heimdallarchaeota archaeon]